TDEISTDDLMYWATNTVMGAADKAFKGEGEFRCGEWCRFCRIKAACRARAQENLKLAKHDFKDPPLLTDDEIAEVMFAADELQSWVKDVQAYALDQAVNHGKDWPGFKLIEGRSYRRYSDEAEAAQILKAAGYSEEQIYSKNLLGITAMEKLLGKKRFNEILETVVIKPPGKPKLAPESDKRPAIKSTAEIDFKEEL
ncbi:MAG: DUF2800 domain-containing protein, partial [Firmicutes bacterium]|nr:DUF2800 domain-containing protein [Bacillota bacterium]